MSTDSYSTIVVIHCDATLHHMLQAEKVVVTGCCGRIGRAVASHLSEQFTVHGIDRSPRPAGLAPAVQHHQFELSDSAQLASTILGAYAVVHLAACPDDADFSSVLLPSNVAAVVAVLEACKAAQVQKVVIASSGKVHAGHNGPYPIRLNDSATTVCNYGATKLFAEGAAQGFAMQTGTPTLAIRFAWCPRVPADIVAMRAATKPGSGANEFVSPDDAARCVAAALKCTKESLAAASHPPTPAPFAVIFCQSVPLEAGANRFDMEPTRQLLNFSPVDQFDDAKHSELCATDYTDNPGIYPRGWP